MFFRESFDVAGQGHDARDSGNTDVGSDNAGFPAKLGTKGLLHFAFVKNGPHDVSEMNRSNAREESTPRVMPGTGGNYLPGRPLLNDRWIGVDAFDDRRLKAGPIDSETT